MIKKLRINLIVPTVLFLGFGLAYFISAQTVVLASIACNGSKDVCNVNASNPVSINWSCGNSVSGSVSNNGDSTVWSGTSGSQTLGGLIDDTIFFLTCGGTNETATSNVLINVVSGTPTDITPPGVVFLDITVTSPSLTRIAWEVTDSGGSFLDRVSIDRAPFNTTFCADTNRPGCSWTTAAFVNAIPNSNDWGSAIYDSLSVPGQYIYRIRVFDNAGNMTIYPFPPPPPPTPAGVVQGWVFEDKNQNRFFDTEDYPGIGGARVSLMSPDLSAKLGETQTVSGGSIVGYFEFSSVPLGNYAIVLDPVPAGYGIITSNPDYITVSSNVGVVYLFALVLPTPTSVPPPTPTPTPTLPIPSPTSTPTPTPPSPTLPLPTPPSTSSGPAPTASAPPPPPAPAAQSFDFLFEIPNPFSGQITTFNDLIDAIILFLYYIVGPIIVAMIVLAGLFFLFGRGEPGKVETGKKILLYAVIGLIIILIGRGFITLLQSIIDLGV